MPIRCQSVEQEDETINNLGVDSCFLKSCREEFLLYFAADHISETVKNIGPGKENEGSQ